MGRSWLPQRFLTQWVRFSSLGANVFQEMSGFTAVFHRFLWFCCHGSETRRGPERSPHRRPDCRALRFRVEPAPPRRVKRWRSLPAHCPRRCDQSCPRSAPTTPRPSRWFCWTGAPSRGGARRVARRRPPYLRRYSSSPGLISMSAIRTSSSLVDGDEFAMPSKRARRAFGNAANRQLPFGSTS